MSELRKPIPPPSLEMGLVRCYSRGRSVIAYIGAMHQHSKSLVLLSLEEVSKNSDLGRRLVTKHEDMLYDPRERSTLYFTTHQKVPGTVVGSIS